MRLLLINPNTTVAMTSHMLEAATLAVADTTAISGVTVQEGVPFIDGYYDEAIAAAGVAQCVIEHAGTFDAAVIACFGDPGLYAAREVSDKLVLGIAEASFSVAMMLGHRFGIVSTVDRATPGLVDLLRRYGIESRCAAVEATDVEVLALDDDPRGAIDALLEAGRRAIRAGAEVLCLGCGALVGVRSRLEAELAVPVVEPVPVAARMAEALGSLGMRTSKIRAFAHPATVLMQ